MLEISEVETAGGVQAVEPHPAENAAYEDEDADEGEDYGVGVGLDRGVHVAGCGTGILVVGELDLVKVVHFLFVLSFLDWRWVKLSSTECRLRTGVGGW